MKTLSTLFQRRHSLLLVISLAALCILSALRTLQGIDFSDVGFYASNYKFFFSAPENIIYSQMYWLSNFFGALVWALTGGQGLLSLNLAGLFIFAFLLVISIPIWSKYYPNKTELAWVLCLSFLVSIPYVLTINYNGLSLFFLGLSALCFVLCESRQNLFYASLAGFLFGVGVGCRFPNLVFVVAIFFFTGKDRKKLIAGGLLFLLGLALSLGAQILLAKTLGHVDYIKEALMIVANKSSDGESTHSMGRLLNAYRNDFFRNTNECLGLALFFYLVRRSLLKGRWAQVLGDAKKEKSLYIATAILVAAILFNASGMRLFLVITVLGLAYFVIRDRCRISFVLLMFAGALSAGSNSGFFDTRASFCITLPWLLYRINMLLDSKPGAITTYTRKIVYIVLAVVSIKTVAEVWHDTYRDGPSPLKMTALTEVPPLKGIRTTPERALVINELYSELQKVPAGSQVVAYSEMPMVFLIGDIQNPIFNIWPDLYEFGQFKYAFAKGVENKNLKPYILLNKFSLRETMWPIKQLPVRGREVDRNYKFIQEFKSTNGYQLQWENSTFELWAPAA